MITLTAANARKELHRLIAQVALAHEPVLITGNRNNAVLISEEDWRGIQETLYLMHVPGMAESIKAGMQTPASEMDEDLDFCHRRV